MENFPGPHNLNLIESFDSGKLHRHIVQLQVSEGTAVRKLEDSNKKIFKLQAQLLRAEQLCDDKDQGIYHNRLENRSKTKYLKHTVQVSRCLSHHMSCLGHCLGGPLPHRNQNQIW